MKTKTDRLVQLSLVKKIVMKKLEFKTSEGSSTAEVTKNSVTCALQMCCLQEIHKKSSSYNEINNIVKFWKRF